MTIEDYFVACVLLFYVVLLIIMFYIGLTDEDYTNN